jgi:hypothetical protein
VKFSLQLCGKNWQILNNIIIYNNIMKRIIIGLIVTLKSLHMPNILHNHLPLTFLPAVDLTEQLITFCLLTP